MTYLLAKSNENFSCGMKINQSGNYLCSSIHCLYYSCIQLMIHVLIEFSKRTENEIYESAKSEGNSHQYYIREVQNLIEQRNRGLVLQYKRIEDLKTFRVKSDYRNIPINLYDSDRALEIAQVIRDLLKSVFKIKE